MKKEDFNSEWQFVKGYVPSLKVLAMYEISVTGAKKKTLGKLKKGKVTVKIHYKISKKEKKKDLFAYTINKRKCQKDFKILL